MTDKTNAIIHFWDHSEISPGVHIYGVTQDSLRGIIVTALGSGGLARSKSPAVQAATFVVNIADTPGEYEVGLVNAPVGVSMGQTLGRMQSPNHAPGGLGLLLLDIAADELQTFGGPGLVDEDYNQWQVRTTELSALLPPAGAKTPRKKAGSKKKGSRKEAAPTIALSPEDLA
jgi:hypothetical protein